MSGPIPEHEYAKLKDLSLALPPDFFNNSEFKKRFGDDLAPAGEMLSMVSACLRAEAKKVGKDLDKMIQFDPDLGAVARSVTIDVTARTLMATVDGTPMSQMTQSAGGYSVTGTYLVPGGGMFIKKSELARLGLRRQKVGVISFYDTD